MKRVILLAIALATFVMVGCGSGSNDNKRAEQWLVNNIDYIYHNDGSHEEIFYLNPYMDSFDNYLLKYDLVSGIVEEVTCTPTGDIRKWDGFSSWIVPEDRGLVEPCKDFAILGFYRVFRNPAAENKYVLSYDINSGQYRTICKGNGFRFLNNSFVKFNQSWGLGKYAIRSVNVHDKNGNEIACQTFVGEVDGKQNVATVYVEEYGTYNMFVLLGAEKSKDKDFYAGTMDAEGNFNLEHRYDNCSFNGKFADGKLTGVITTQAQQKQVTLAPQSGAANISVAATTRDNLPVKESVVKWIKENIPHVVDKANNALYLFRQQSNVTLEKVDLESGVLTPLTLKTEDGKYEFSEFSSYVLPEDRGYNSQNPQMIIVGKIHNKIANKYDGVALRYESATNKLTELITADYVYGSGQYLLAGQELANVYPTLLTNSDFYDANMQKITPRVFKGTVNGKPATAEVVISENGEVLAAYYMDKRPNHRVVLRGKHDAAGTVIFEGLYGTSGYENWRCTIKDGVISGSFKYEYAFTKRSGSVSLVEQK